MREERIRSVSGKGIATTAGSSNLIFPTETRITLSKDLIKSEYFSGATVIGTGSIFTRPFFGESGYVVDTLSGTLQSGVTLSATGTGDTIIVSYYPEKDMSIQYIGASCGSPPCTLVQAELTTGFNKRSSTLSIDSRSGVIQKK